MGCQKWPWHAAGSSVHPEREGGRAGFINPFYGGIIKREIWRSLGVTEIRGRRLHSLPSGLVHVSASRVIYSHVAFSLSFYRSIIGIVHPSIHQSIHFSMHPFTLLHPSSIRPSINLSSIYHASIGVICSPGPMFPIFPKRVLCSPSHTYRGA